MSNKLVAKNILYRIVLYEGRLIKQVLFICLYGPVSQPGRLLPWHGRLIFKIKPICLGFKSRPVHLIKMKKRKIKAVIFDLGNTLLKIKKEYFPILKRRHKLDIGLDFFRKASSEVFARRYWKNIDEGIQKFAKSIGQHKNPDFKKHFKELYRNQKNSFVKFPGTEKILRELNKNGYKTAIITNWNQNCMDVIEHYNLKDYFHHIAISALEGVRKPSPKLFRRVLKYLNVKPEEALMVGDSHDHDYLAAKKIGMHSLLLERKEKKHSHSIRNLRQVVSYIKKINGKF